MPNEKLSVPDLLRASVPQHVDINELFSQFSESVEAEIQQIITQRDAGNPVIPELTFSQLCKTGFTSTLANHIRRSGCVVVRGVFDDDSVQAWNHDIDSYLNSNRYYEKLKADIAAGNTQRAENEHMLDIFWSKTQLEIRQSSQIEQLQRHLNSLWTVCASGPGAFDPNRSYTYADRIRVREPFDRKHGLLAHVDSCSMESWFSTDTIANAYGCLLNGNWQEFDAFNAVNRALTDRKPHKDSCSVFRTYQGWMALTPQGEGTGSLQLVPSSRCVAWMFLSMLKDALDHDSLVSPLPSEAYMLHPQRHALLINGLCPLSPLRPGDTVWWHPDAVHGVEQNNLSALPSSVAYLGIAPKCERNRRYMQSQFDSFTKGESPPDFPNVHMEVGYEGRAKREHLTAFGAQQMGTQPCNG